MFAFVPASHRIFFMSTIATFWGGYCSYVAHRGEAATEALTATVGHTRAQLEECEAEVGRALRQLEEAREELGTSEGRGEEMATRLAQAGLLTM